MRRWRGLEALVHDAIDATTELVREGHDSTHRAVLRVTDRIDGIAGPARAVDGVVRAGTSGTLASVKLVNRVVQTLLDAALDESVPVSPAPGPLGPVAPDVPPIALRSDILGSAPWIADAALGTVNGAIGHHLAATGNALDLGLTLRHGDRYLDLAAPTALSGAVVVLVHGLGATEWCWAFGALAHFGDAAATFGSMLQRDTGASPVFVRYNSGRRIAESGGALAEALERLVAGSGITRVVLLGHSMGGLVARAACHTASQRGHRWLDAVDLVVSLGTPHQGASLARFGESAAAGLGAVDLPATRILSRVLAGRSAGIRDLEHGTVGEPDVAVPLLDGLTYAFLSATVTPDPEHPVAHWLGDLLVQVGSASGPAHHEIFPIRVGTFGGVVHHQMQCHPEVYARVRELVLGTEVITSRGS
jgi:triacylglycerol lipase